MACQGNILFELSRQNIKEIKKFIESQENIAQAEVLFAD